MSVISILFIKSCIHVITKIRWEQHFVASKTKNIFIKQSVVKQLNIITDWFLYLSFFSLRIPLVEEFILFSPARRKYLASASNYSIYLLCLGGRGVSFGLITLLTYFSFILRPLPREKKPSLLSYIIFPLYSLHHKLLIAHRGHFASVWSCEFFSVCW